MKTKEQTNSIERVHFHLCNGGLTLNIVESEATYDFSREEGPSEIVTYTHYQLHATFSHFGSVVDVSLPLGSMEVVGWLHEVTGRLLRRMQGKQDQAKQYCFERIGRLQEEDGQAVDEHFQMNGTDLVKVPAPVSTLGGSDAQG